MLDGTPQTPREFAADMINGTKETINNMSSIGHSVERATAIGQVQALTALAASVLALVDELATARQEKK